ncbi:hypothetical protein L2E82_02632 [Cichorium intybus]|uniref:Uncharacterized protein n=1 Tax=Cichorium intybus TaxID=13427 RepID=A0ACB9H3C1_CICIN|nr:hypothetical protein L2E82_02632 [Cichorium intybus]
MILSMFQYIHFRRWVTVCVLFFFFSLFILANALMPKVFNQIRGPIIFLVVVLVTEVVCFGNNFFICLDFGAYFFSHTNTIQGTSIRIRTIIHDGIKIVERIEAVDKIDVTQGIRVIASQYLNYMNYGRDR